jgi:hypothetical protein
MRRFLVVLTTCLLVCTWMFGQQVADPNFDASVKNPAYTSEHPKVMIDEAHRNFHTAAGRYRAFAELLRHDGYEVVSGTKPFAAESLAGVRVLVIANALGGEANAGTDTSVPAFTAEECEAVAKWVRGGGSLLLISDHTPFGMAAENLGTAVGVQMGKGFVMSLDAKTTDGEEPTRLLFSRENGLLGEHAIMRGRNDAEKINRVVAFTGQSLSVPEGAVALMKLAPAALEAPSRSEARALYEDASKAESSHTPLQTKHGASTKGAQGIAFRLGKGRVVVLGEAAMMSAQVVGPKGEGKMGMNAPGNDDRQFALNTLHWLSGLLN